ncbi:unnamed protein product [Miscanthus lutarioriparius]|uniref:Uncharacterized protein n=1 Tax=Miscanthus lutarioriparius TaxID=422564 RepID=A0A811RQL4_9POAL|nr:unnamed protein product [Miscanthus lutarioriparius]
MRPTLSHPAFDVKQMRQLKGEVGVVARADGSALFEMGNTRVIAAVYGPREVQNKGQQVNINEALVRCEYRMAEFSTGDRRRKPKGDRRSTEISLVIRQTMEASILTHLMPRSQIDIYVQVLQADGGTRSACINAATLALADAGIPMRDIVTSCSAGYLCSTPLLDLNYLEDSAGGSDVTVGILAKMDKVTLLQMDAKLPMDTFENVMGLAIEGCKAIASYIRESLTFGTSGLLTIVLKQCMQINDLNLSKIADPTMDITQPLKCLTGCGWMAFVHRIAVHRNFLGLLELPREYVQVIRSCSRQLVIIRNTRYASMFKIMRNLEL